MLKISFYTCFIDYKPLYPTALIILTIISKKKKKKEIQLFLLCQWANPERLSEESRSHSWCQGWNLNTDLFCSFHSITSIRMDATGRHKNKQTKKPLLWWRGIYSERILGLGLFLFKRGTWKLIYFYRELFNLKDLIRLLMCWQTKWLLSLYSGSAKSGENVKRLNIYTLVYSEQMLRSKMFYETMIYDNYIKEGK